ncbi:hypothetical protein FRB93_003023 [Tulasnella sp. JGI-2019a]|nr:hypothetical protein FRB93_003023 [Tulasnella sp. JGI-2019a]
MQSNPWRPVLQQILDLLLLDCEAEKHDTDGVFTGAIVSSRARRLEILDRKINYLLTANPAVQNAIREAIDRLRHQRSALTPVHGLPMEVLIQVFRHVSGVDIRPARADTIESLHTLAKVCKTWANVIKGIPALWAVVHGAHSQAEWTSALKLSSSHPLTLNLIDDYQREEAYILLWDSVSEHVWRWQSAWIVLVPYMNLSSLEGDPAPILRELRLKGDGMLPSGRSLDLFRGRRGSKLLHVNLEGVSLRDWSSPTLSGLHSLTLRNFIAEPALSLSQFYGVLRACPSLRHLCIHAVVFLNDGTNSVISPGIPLSQLRELDLHNRTNIFGAIDNLAMCNDLKIWCPDALLPSYLPLIIPHISPCFLAQFPSNQCIAMDIIGGSVRLRVLHGGDQRLPDSYTLHLYGIDGISDVLNKIIDLVIAAPSDVHLTLSIQQLEHMKIAWVRDPLWRLRHVESLEIVQCGSRLDEILHELSTPRAMAMGGGRERWMFPRLKHMTLKDSKWWTWGLLLDMLNSRATGGEEQRPDRLEGLRICAGSTMKMQVFEGIRAILGNAAVWEGHDFSGSA